MNVIKSIKLAGFLLSLSVILYGRASFAFPLPTMDMTRLAQSAKTVKLQIDQVQQEIESNLHIIKQIQNGGYAAAARELFGKVQNGDYDRFGALVKNLGVNLEISAKSAQALASNREKRKEINLGLAEAEARRKQAAAEKAKAQAEAAVNENVEQAKKSGFNRAYNWAKRYGLSATNTVIGTVDAIDDGGNIIDVGKNIKNNTSASLGDITNKVKEDQKDLDDAKKKAQEEIDKRNEEELKKTLENMKKDTPSTNDLINDSLKKQAEQTGLLGGK